jgi:hypothetical protein
MQLGNLSARACNLLFATAAAIALVGAVFQFIPALFLGCAWMLSGTLLPLFQSYTVKAHVVSGAIAATAVCTLYSIVLGGGSFVGKAIASLT